MDAPLALYRRYRPETFAEVIGQDHVTGPLRAALASNRVNHAYLFSGPRGCGKTTSARILARALNCEQGPTPEPCGVCRSCIDLARGGPGSIDVIEIDAASHGGVDDARDLREKAFFAPVSSRYKVYIIDEAHMVTTQGFNALLKLVEEPPPHLKFVFATTEPEKVIGTIRSRTHHYPFRLIPPRTLSAYLSDLCQREGVAIEPAALPLVVRAGGGSARDTLSVLDQLIGGSGDDGVTLGLTTALLGYTPDALLDDVVDAFSAGDGATVFDAVDRVVESGQDPRRFTEDLLRRLRDLVVISAVPDAPATGLVDVGEEQAERLVAQSAHFGRAELSRAADLVAVGLTEMRGATAPRLLLELICARVLLPTADDTTAGVLARLDRLERRVHIEGGTPSGAAVVSPPADPTPSARAEHVAPARRQAERPPVKADPPEAPAAAQPSSNEPTPDYERPASARAEQPHRADPPGDRTPAETPPAEATHDAPAAAAAAERAQPARASQSGLSLADVRRLWPDVVEAVKQRRRVTWIHLSTQAQVMTLEGEVLTLGFKNAGARDSFIGGGSPEIVRQTLIDVVGADWRIEAIVDAAASPGAETAPKVTRAAVDSRSSAPAPAAEQAPAPQQAPRPAARRPDSGPPLEEPPAEEPPPDEWAGPATSRLRPWEAAAAAAADQSRHTPTGPAHVPDDEVDPEDPTVDAGLGGAALLERELGASLIEEIRHD